MRKTFHNSRPLDPSHSSLQQQDVRGIGNVISTSTNRQTEQVGEPNEEGSSGNNNYHDAYRNSRRYGDSSRYHSYSYKDSSKASVEPSEGTTYKASITAKQPTMPSSWSGDGNTSSVDDDEDESDISSEDQGSPGKPMIKSSVSKYSDSARNSIMNNKPSNNTAMVPGHTNTNKRYNLSASAASENANYNRTNSDAFSSSSNDTTSEEDDKYMPSRSTVTSTHSSAAGSRYSSHHVRGSSDTAILKNTKITATTTTSTTTQREDKISIILRQRLSSRDSSNVGQAGHAGSAFDQALEHVKTSSTLDVASSSNEQVVVAENKVNSSGRIPVASTLRRNESGTVVGSLHLQNPPSTSPLLTQQKSLDHQQRRSPNLNEGNHSITEGQAINKTNTAGSNVEEMQEGILSKKDPTFKKSLREDDELMSILSFVGIAPELPEKGTHPLLSNNDMPALDALASATMGQKQLQQLKFTVPAAATLTPQQQPKGDATGSETPPPPPPPGASSTLPNSTPTGGVHHIRQTSMGSAAKNRTRTEDLASGVLPDVLMTMREKLESLSLFDSDMMKLADTNSRGRFEEETEEERNAKASLQRSFQQSISAAVLVSLAHKRYERRRLGAMEVEKIVRSLVAQKELERVRAILLLLSDDYVRSTSEDARKGGVVALAACEIGLKKADERNPSVIACKDLILASVVQACQDPNQRVRYYATESLFNVVKVIPLLAVQHFFILFEILRSLYADVDLDVRSGAQLLDKKLKEIIVGAINGGTFHVERCIPLFVRFIYMKNKATKRLTITWLQEFSEKLVGNPLLEFVHLFLGGVFAMIADPSSSIRQLALGFLQTVLPQLLVSDDDALFEDGNSSFHKVDFDKILQSLVTIMEHPDPFVRKVAMYWTNQIISAHMGLPPEDKQGTSGGISEPNERSQLNLPNSAACISVRNSLPHVLPGILLSIGDAYHSRSTTRDTYFFASQTTHSLAEDTNQCLQYVVKRDGKAFVSHLDGFIVTLLEELDSPGGLGSRNAQAVERKPYRMDVKQDGTGIETTGWFRAAVVDLQKLGAWDDANGQKDNVETNSSTEESMLIMSRLCALQWIAVLYEYVVPCSLKPDYAREFISPILHQLVYNPPDVITFKSFEVLAKITVPVFGEEPNEASEKNAIFKLESDNIASIVSLPNVDVLDESRLNLRSRDRSVFSVLIRLYSRHPRLLTELSKVIQFMCTLQPPEFVFVSFAVELDLFVSERGKQGSSLDTEKNIEGATLRKAPSSKDLDFVSSFVQQMNVVLLISKETEELRNALKEIIGPKKSMQISSDVKKKQQLFHVLLHSFAHNLVSAISLCLWGGAYLTASLSLHEINAMDIHLLFFLEVDQLIELLERPLLRHIHLRMLEGDHESNDEGSGAMLLRTLKSLLMLLPQSTSFSVLRDRLLIVSKYRQTTMTPGKRRKIYIKGTLTELFVSRLRQVRKIHYTAKWDTVRAESLEVRGRLFCETATTVEEPTEERKGVISKSEEIENQAVVGRFHLNDHVASFRTLSKRRLVEEAQTPIISNGNLVPLNRVTRKTSQGASADKVDDDYRSSKKWRDFWDDAGK